ncbi:MAG: hypothetical protein ACE5FT_05800 [Candidatus Nanoarchaeia archaeon]
MSSEVGRRVDGESKLEKTVGCSFGCLMALGLMVPIVGELMLTYTRHELESSGHPARGNSAKPFLAFVGVKYVLYAAALEYSTGVFSGAYKSIANSF